MSKKKKTMLKLVADLKDDDLKNWYKFTEKHPEITSYIGVIRKLLQIAGDNHG